MSQDEGETNLSLAQRGFLFVHDYFDRAQVLNTGLCLHLRGALDREALRRALDLLVDRHDQLRTTFHRTQGVARAVEHEGVSQPVYVVDVSHLSESEANAELRRTIQREIQHRFDLTRLPLLRVTLVTLGNERHALILVNHHATGDGTSFFQIYLNDLASAYAAFASGADVALEPLEGGYEDFVAWERGRNSGRNLERRLKYWSSALAGAPPYIDLPTDRPRPPTPSGAGGRFEGPSIPGLLQRVTTLAQSQGTSPLAVLLATFYLVLSRYSRQEDLVVGVPMANRRESIFEHLYGCMINTLPIRVQANPTSSFHELLQATQVATFRGVMHMDLAFEKLVESLGRRNHLSRSEVHQVVFNFMPFSPESITLFSLDVQVERLFPDATFLDLIVEVAEGPRGLGVAVNYNADIYSVEFVKRLVQHYHLVLEGVLTDPTRTLLAYPMVTGEEIRQLRDWNAATAAEFPGDRLLHHVVEAQVERTPDAPAVTSSGVTLTYRELDARANAVAERLAALGAGRGTIVAHCTDRSVELLVGVLGILKTGAAYLPLDPTFPEGRLAFMLADSGAKLLVTEASHAGCFGTDVERVLLPLGEASGTRPRPAVDPDDLAYVMYTSGSTGRPKGVEIRHAATVNFLHAMQRELKLDATDRMLALTTLSFDISILELFLPLMTGAQIALVERADAMDGRRLRHVMSERGVTCIQATPITYRILLEVGWSGGQGLKALCGGEAFPADLIEPLTSRCAEVWNMYGPTETTVWSTMDRVEPGATRAFIGRPVANTQAYVLDAALGTVPIGVTGQLFLGGEGLARGYHDRPELTAERFVMSPRPEDGHLYATGDLARFHPDGRLEYIGRVDEQVKLRGFRIELGEIEARLLDISGIQQAAVGVMELEGQGPQLVAYVTGSQSLSDKEIRARLGNWLPAYMTPQTFVRLSELPLTPNGKVNRRALPPPKTEQRNTDPLLPALERVEDADQWWWQWAFVRKDLASDTPCKGSWLLFVDALGIGQRLAKLLRSSGDRVTCVRSADKFHRSSDDDYALNPELGRSEYETLVDQLAASGAQPDRIVHLWSLANTTTFRPGSNPFHRTQEHGHQSVAWLFQALSRRGSGRGSTLFAVGNSICSLHGQPARYAEGGMLLGVCGTIPRELGATSATCIDVELPKGIDDESGATRLVERLAQEVRQPPRERLVAYRGAARYVRTLERTAPVPARTLPPRGCYVITGGLGQVGQALARTLLEGGGRVVIIDARGTAPGEPLSGRSGAVSLELPGVDVANLRQMSAALAEARRFLGHIDGVFHLAANSRQTRLLDGDEIDFDAVVAPRVHGLRVLTELLRDLDVAFVVTATELDGCTHRLGSLASAVADAYVHTACRARTNTSGPILIAVGLGPVMHHRAASSDAVAVVDDAPARDGAMRPVEASQALLRAATSDQSSVFASTVNLLDWSERIGQRGETGDDSTPHGSHVPPSSALQRRLSQLFCDVLGIPQVSVTDSFFDLGGHSLLAVRLFGKIEAEFSLELPLVTLFKAPRVEALAQIIEAAKAGEQNAGNERGFRYLVRLQEGAVRERPPLFVVSGAFGNVLNLRHLAALTTGTRDFYGLQARGLIGGDLPHRSFAEAATDFLEEVRNVQPKGPYLLGGFCTGGIVALEMARQLQKSGESVPLVIMFDTLNPATLLPLDLTDRLYMHFDGVRKGGLNYIAQHLRRRLEWERGRLREAFGMDDNVPKDAALYRSEVVFQASELATREYVPAYYDGAVVLFRPPLNPLFRVSGGRSVNDQREFVLHDGGWQHWVRSLEVHEVAAAPGDHDGFVLEPYVRDLAARLNHKLSLLEEP